MCAKAPGQELAVTFQVRQGCCGRSSVSRGQSREVGLGGREGPEQDGLRVRPAEPVLPLMEPHSKVLTSVGGKSPLCVVGN